MGEQTGIAWCDHTFNPWRGCSRVSPGCDNCYAESWSHRNPAQLGTWGDDGERVIGGEAYWRTPLRWDRLAAEAGVRSRVFCASLADVFEDRPELEHPRRRLFELISDTPHLDWLLLTKRPENAWWMLQREYNDRVGAVLSAAHDGRGTVPTVWPLPNVWLGVTAEDQERADERIPILLATPAAVRFVSYEPALGPIDFSCSVGSGCGALSLGWTFSAGQGDHHPSGDGRGGWWSDLGHMPGEPPQVDWVIVGGESGSRARPFDVQWARDTITQGRAAGTPVFVKQLGAVPVTEGRELDLVHDRKGGDMSEWPEDLRVREFPVLGGG